MARTFLRIDSSLAPALDSVMSHGGRRSSNVLAVSNSLQVIWIDARRDEAEMVDGQPVRDFVAGIKERKAVREHRLGVSGPEPAIAKFACGSSPNPARTKIGTRVSIARFIQ